MKAKTPHLGVYIGIIIAGFMIVLFIILNNRITSEFTPNYNLDDFYTFPERKVGVNEYKVAAVSSDDMVYTYFNTFVNMLFNDIEKSYSYIDEDYKNDVLPNMGAYRTFVSDITNNFTSIPEISKYNLKEKEDKKIYTIKDKNNNTYIFTVTAVMQYTVTFD